MYIRTQRALAVGVSVKSLKEEKKQLEKEIHDKQIAELDQLVSESGLSIEDIKKLITKNK